MADVERADGLRLSISRLAQEFGMSRETVSKRLAAGGVRPDGKRQGYPIYRLRDAAPALLDTGPAFGVDETGAIDPDRMLPRDRKDWYDSEHRRRQLQTQDRELVPALEVEQAIAAIVRQVARTLDTLPDVLERDAGIAGAAVERAQQVIDSLREELYQRVTGDVSA